jgi:AcrR family transcriptional regulator
VAVAKPVRARAGAARPGLSREVVLRAALAVADADGIDALTLRRLAQELDVHPTSIYNHVPSKEAILDGVTETLFIEANLPTTVDDWRSWVRVFADAMRRIARDHPGAFTVFLRQTASGPVAIRHAEAAMDAFRRDGFSADAAARALHGTSLALLGLALDETPMPAPVVAPDLSHLTAADYPRLFEAEQVVDRYDTGPTWELMVESLIEGLAATHRSVRRPRKRGR